jgi:hypothetical protein
MRGHPGPGFALGRGDLDFGHHLGTSAAHINKGDSDVSFATGGRSELHAPRLHGLARERELTWINMACQLACADGAPISKEVRMRILAAAILAIGLLSAAGQARAQTYDPAFPVCMHRTVWGGAFEDCTYYTLAQCAASAFGNAGLCSVNPYYAGATASLPPNDRRHRRGY